MLWRRSKALEFKPLPMNIPQFKEWSGRIIKAAELPTKSTESQEFALASMIAQTPPHEFHRPDEYYVNCLRKAAADQVALQVMEDIKSARRDREAQSKTPAVTPKLVSVGDEKKA